MLTTFDNDINPYEDFTAWYLRDCELGWNSSVHLSAIIEYMLQLNNIKNYEELTEPERDFINEQAIDFIICHDPLNIYRKVFE